MTTLIGADFTSVIAAADLGQGKAFGLGDRVTDDRGNEYAFVQYGTGGAAANGVVSITAASAAVMLSNSAGLRGERVGVAMATAVATEYGWAMVNGATNVLCAAAAAANTPLASTTTAGSIDDATGAGTKNILGMVLTTAATDAGAFAALLTYPTVGSTN